MENNLNAELIEKARQAKSPEELLALAKENGQELTEEQAKAYFEQMNKTGELSDDELDNVAGGGCHTSNGKLIVTSVYACDKFLCEYCGKPAIRKYDQLFHESCSFGMPIHPSCTHCQFMSHLNDTMVCDHPANFG